MPPGPRSKRGPRITPRSGALIGTTFSHYRITDLLGRGGMGEVYRATDDRLGREVALKLLPEGFAADSERSSRFEREARVLAALNHPNIATLYGLESIGERHALVMELVEGEGLDERIARSPLDPDELVAIAKQIAAALAAAHDQGILHRDLKPANVRVRPDGTVKVLDFGLAKAWQQELPASAMALSPTLTRQGTVEGVILGTAAYMSPEQARGKPLDQRSDLWSFGVVLWETVTGRALFAGETSSDVLAAVLRAEIDWGALPPSTPAQVVSLLHLLLERDPTHRLRDAGSAGVLLEAPAATSAITAPASALRPVRRRGWLVGIAAALALAALAGVVGRSLRPAAPRPPLRKFELGRAGESAGLNAVRPVISPDGRHLALFRDNEIQVRDLSQLEARRLEGTAAAQMLTWSPDGEWLAFGSGTRLLKVPVAGGAVQPIAELPGRPSSASGAAWLPDGRIYFTTGGSGLLAVLAQGGEPETVLEPAEGENDFHHVTPLPDGRSVMFLVHGRQEVDTVAVFDGERRVDVLHLEGGLDWPIFAPGGFLLFERGESMHDLWAVPFSLDDLRTTGEPFLVAAHADLPSVSADGTLVYVQSGGSHLRQLAWFDRDGALVETLGEPRPGLDGPALSPDGTRVVASVEEEGDSDLWILDLASGSWNRLTFTPTPEFAARWMPDGDRVVFHCGRPAEGKICVQAADGSAPAEVVVEEATFGLDPSPDGRFLVYEAAGAGTRDDLWLLEMGGESAPLLATTDFEAMPRVSPDGRLLAHVAWGLGAEEIFVREFPSGAGKWQISSRGGRFPVWSGDELFFLEGQTLVARRVTTEGGVRVGPEQRLFDLPSPEALFDVSRDGQRILAVKTAGEAKPDQIVLVQSWADELGSR